MKEFIILTLVVFIFSIYCILTVRKYGIQPSISLTAKKLGRQNFLFYIWGVLWIFPLMLLQINGLWIGALFIQAFVFATYTFYENRIAKVVHNVASFAGPILAMLAISIYADLWFIFVHSLAVSFLSYRIIPSNKIWWLEVVAFFLIILNLAFFS